MFLDIERKNPATGEWLNETTLKEESEPFVFYHDRPGEEPPLVWAVKVGYDRSYANWTMYMTSLRQDEKPTEEAKAKLLGDPSRWEFRTALEINPYVFISHPPSQMRSRVVYKFTSIPNSFPLDA